MPGGAFVGRTDSGVSFEADNHGALDKGGARVVDAVQHCLEHAVRTIVVSLRESIGIYL